MIEESYVSFDTAKLLKEAGFRELTKTHYSNSGQVWETAMAADYNDDFNCKTCNRPTQALAARWLREVYNLHVYAIQANLPLTEPQTDKWEWGYVIDKVDDPNSNVTTCEMYFGSYEAAFEAGLQEAIKLIKK